MSSNAETSASKVAKMTTAENNQEMGTMLCRFLTPRHSFAIPCVLWIYSSSIFDVIHARDSRSAMLIENLVPTSITLCLGTKSTQGNFCSKSYRFFHNYATRVTCEIELLALKALTWHPALALPNCRAMAVGIDSGETTTELTSTQLAFSSKDVTRNVIETVRKLSR